jgi:hypothetical protein
MPRPNRISTKVAQWNPRRVYKELNLRELVF